MSIRSQCKRSEIPLILYLLIVTAGLFLGPKGHSQDHSVLDEKLVGFKLEHPARIPVPCRGKIAGSKVKITLRCETHEAEEAKYDKEIFKLLNKDGKILYLKEGKVADEAQGSSDSSARKSLGLEDSSSQLAAMFYRMNLINKHSYSRKKQGNELACLNQSFCGTLELILHKLNSLPATAAKGRDQKAQEEIDSHLKELSELCKGEAIPKGGHGLFGKLEQIKGNVTKLIGEELLVRNNTGASSGKYFLPKDFGKLMEDAGNITEQNHQETHDTLIVKMRNLSFVKNIMKSYCASLENGDLDLVVQMGRDHCAGVAALLKNVDPGIKVSRQEMGEAFSVMFKDMGNPGQSKLLSGLPYPKASSCQGMTTVSIPSLARKKLRDCTFSTYGGLDMDDETIGIMDDTENGEY